MKRTSIFAPSSAPEPPLKRAPGLFGGHYPLQRYLDAEKTELQCTRDIISMINDSIIRTVSMYSRSKIRMLLTSLKQLMKALATAKDEYADCTARIVDFSVGDSGFPDRIPSNMFAVPEI